VPRETFTHTSVASVPRETAWAALDRPSTWEGIGGVDRVVDPVVDEEGRLQRFGFLTEIAGRSYRGNATLARRVEGETVSWAIDSGEVRGSITVDLADRSGSTQVTATIELDSVGFLSSMFFPVITGAIRSGLAGTVDHFAAGLGTSV
jgi:hypothetical protein